MWSSPATLKAGERLRLAASTIPRKGRTVAFLLDQRELIKFFMADQILKGG